MYAKGFAHDLLSVSFSQSRAMQVRMQPESEISVLVVDRNGKPVSNARVTPGQMFFRRSAWISNVPNRLPGHLESRTDANGVAKLQKLVCNCLVSVVDVTDSACHQGIAVQFFLRDRIDNITGEARSNEDGVCEVAVQPGEWTFSINDTTLPDGYCVYYPERSTKFTVVQSYELQTAPPVYVGKGQLIEGKIVGLDMSEIRFDWISARVKDESQSWMGRVNELGEFRILVPNYVELDSVSEFQIGTSGRGTLALESKKPWVLKWTPKEESNPNE